MTARHVLRELRRHGIRAERRGARLRLTPPPPAWLLERVRQHRHAILERIDRRRLILNYRLADRPNRWLRAAGYAGETESSLRADLRQRFGERLLEVAR